MKSIDTNGLLVFILEADSTTAIELDAIASHLGCRSIAAFHSCEIAERWLEIFTPDLAIVDRTPEAGDCNSLIAILDERDVPLLLYGGAMSSGRSSSRSTGVAVIPNPSPPHIVLASMESVLKGHGNGCV
jgi:hypothetical protein